MLYATTKAGNPFKKFRGQSKESYFGPNQLSGIAWTCLGKSLRGWRTGKSSATRLESVAYLTSSLAISSTFFSLRHFFISASRFLASCNVLYSSLYTSATGLLIFV